MNYICPCCKDVFSPDDAKGLGFLCPGCEGIYVVASTSAANAPGESQNRTHRRAVRQQIPSGVLATARALVDYYFSTRAAIYVAAALFVLGVINFGLAAFIRQHRATRSVGQVAGIRLLAEETRREDVDMEITLTGLARDEALDVVTPHSTPQAQFFVSAGDEGEPPSFILRQSALNNDLSVDGEGFIYDDGADEENGFEALVASFWGRVAPSDAVLNPAAAVYPASRARSGFYFGGQVLDFGENAAANMRYAGMGWVKFQVHVGDLDAPEKIQRAHGRGFKALVGLMGEPGRVLEPAYIQEFAAYAGEVAAAGADAIEIWNEPNISRDWPAGQISARAYLSLLRPSYLAIKGQNPRTLVVSAGLAPTLMAKDLRTEDFWTEVDFSRQLVAAGGLNYLDCVGVHYNIGNAPPDVTNSELTGDAAFFYVPRILQHYASITQGRRPVCFTEFGYLTDDGYDDLLTVAPGFQWARDNTIDEQAQWLAQAYSMVRVSPQVEMLIVWNVDYWHYGADPHAGYAIIRPGGGCPACEALHRVQLPAVQSN